MKTLVIDIETRARIGITGGAWKYAAHESTEIMVICIKRDDNPVEVMLNDNLKDNVEYIIENDFNLDMLKHNLEEAENIIAHNMEFEYAMMEELLQPHRHKLVCTMAQAAMCALPLSLEKACEALDLGFSKDKIGNLLMKKMCLPQKGTYIEDAESLIKLVDYCKRDVEATHALYTCLPKLPKKEREIWLAHLDINKRGVPIDRHMMEAINLKAEKHKEFLLEEFQELTGVPSPSCIQQTVNWLKSKGLNIDNLTAPILNKCLQEDLTKDVRRCLELRQNLSKTSTAKYAKMVDCLQEDDVVRGQFCYHGATTGRWTGRGVQFLNLKRGALDDFTIECLRNKNLSSKAIEMLFGKNTFYALISKAIRSTVKAKKKFVCCDFSSIEAVVIAWLSGQNTVLKAFLEGDIYLPAAAKIYNKPENTITSDERQIGKISVLACGYQGGKGAFQAMAKAYGVGVTDEFAQDIVTKWREAHPCIVRFWNVLESGFINAVRNHNTAVASGAVVFKLEGVTFPYVSCLLPSGRKLYYPFPNLIKKETPWGSVVDAVEYKTVKEGKWVTTDTYGGKIAENITQAVARDILIDCGFLKFKDDIVLHVYDEILIDSDSIDLEEVKKVMSTSPSWARDLPLAADGWVGMRYRK